MMQSKLLKKIIYEHDIKHGARVNFIFLHNISKIQNIDIKDLIYMLGVVPFRGYIDLERLKNKKYHYIKLYDDTELLEIYKKIFVERLYLGKCSTKEVLENFHIETSVEEFKLIIHKEEKINLEKRILQSIDLEEYISKEQVIQLKEIDGVTSELIKEVFSISDKNFNNLMKNKTKKTRIVVYNVIKKVFLLLMDFKYLEKNKFHTKSELISKSEIIGISLEQLLKNIYFNYKRYKFDLIALEKNKNGIYIGEDHPMSYEFMSENYKEIRQICARIVNKFLHVYEMNELADEVIDFAFEKIVMIGGTIEKNFKFDRKLMFSLFSARCKYIVWGEFRDYIRERINIEKNYRFLIKKNYLIDDCDGIEEFFYIFEEFHNKIVQTIWEKIALIDLDRKKGLKIVAASLNLKYDELLVHLNEIQRKILFYKLARVCRDGKVILMGND